MHTMQLEPIIGNTETHFVTKVLNKTATLHGKGFHVQKQVLSIGQSKMEATSTGLGYKRGGYIVQL